MKGPLEQGERIDLLNCHGSKGTDGYTVYLLAGSCRKRRCWELSYLQKLVGSWLLRSNDPASLNAVWVWVWRLRVEHQYCNYDNEDD